MRRWHHDVVRISTLDLEVVQHTFDTWGGGGWELASHEVSSLAGMVILIFKRREPLRRMMVRMIWGEGA